MSNIQRRPNGRWRARYRDDSGKEHAKHFGRKVDAQAWLDQQTAALVSGTHVDPRAGRITFGAYYAQWSARQVWAPGTERAMSLAVRSTPFHEIELRKIQPTHVEAWVKSMTVATEQRPKSLAPGTIKTRFVNVRSVFRAAVRDKLIAADPSADVRLPRRRKREAAMNIPEPAKVGRILAAADERFRAFVALCALAGLRLGEAAALKREDVDFLRRQIHVQRQVQRAGGGRVDITLPKYGSERVIPMPDELAQILAKHFELLHRTSWLFAGAETDPPHQNTVGHRWRTTLERAKVEGVRLHDLRHFYASGLIADGCDVVTVQRALGHAKASTTLDTYSHLWPSAEDRTRNAASSLAQQVLATPADSLRTEEVN